MKKASCFIQRTWIFSNMDEMCSSVGVLQGFHFGPALDKNTCCEDYFGRLV